MNAKRPSPEKTREIVALFQSVGAAALALDIEDSHSGNIATKWTDADGTAHMAITATGSQKGDLRESDICFPGIDRTTYGHYKASTETDIHAAVLSRPGVGGTLHAHTKHALIETFDDRPKPPDSPIPPLRPLDPLGFHRLGDVPVEWFAVPSGSPEMARLISQRLEHKTAMIIHAHGSFTRGRTVQEALYRAALVENAGRAIWFMRIQGLDTRAVADYIYKDPPRHFPVPPPEFTTEHDGVCNFSDEPDTVAEFLKTGRRIFESHLTTFHTGSLSLRGADTLLYAPKASMPRGLPGPLLERPIAADAADPAELAFHKQIYEHSTFQSIAHTYPPEAEAVVWTLHPEFAADPALRGRGEDESSYIVPVDAEGSFLYLKIPVLPPSAGFEEIMRTLHDYRVIIVRGRGVWAAGEQSLSEVLHRVSSIRDICYYRICAAARRLDFGNLEPKGAKNW
jgi:ribulose-5-phosphate 4-epimerase/fuculose-1-phosphate aldolase